MQTQTTCGTCGGLGKVADKIPAGANAEGLVKTDEEVSINIPAGARDGIQLDVRGKGNDAFWRNWRSISSNRRRTRPFYKT
jgi:molecular chaperone DnaJ